MAITWADVVAVAPPMSSAATATQTAILAIVAIQVDDDAWGEYADIGRCYLAAHLASIRNNTGLVTAETLGPMSRSYGMPGSLTNTFLSTSVYGVEYLRLLRLAVGPAVFCP